MNQQEIDIYHEYGRYWVKKGGKVLAVFDSESKAKSYIEIKNQVSIQLKETNHAKCTDRKN